MIYKDGTDRLRLSKNILPLSPRVVSYTSKTQSINGSKMVVYSVADPGGAEGAMPSLSPVKISHKKDGHQRQPHRFHISHPPYPAAGSATDISDRYRTQMLSVEIFKKKSEF